MRDEDIKWAPADTYSLPPYTAEEWEELHLLAEFLRAQGDDDLLDWARALHRAHTDPPKRGPGQPRKPATLAKQLKPAAKKINRQIQDARQEKHRRDLLKTVDLVDRLVSPGDLSEAEIRDELSSIGRRLIVLANLPSGEATPWLRILVAARRGGIALFEAVSQAEFGGDIDEAEKRFHKKRQRRTRLRKASKPE